MGHGWVPTGVKRHPSLPAGRKADAGEAKGPLLMAFSLPVPAQPLSFIPGLALFSCVGADANVTEGLPCEGCAGNVTQMRRRGHFSRCPEEYRHYCVKGRCRFLVAEAAPACMCERGYTGARCEQVDIFYLRGDRGQIVVISLIAAIVTLIVFVVCVCLCAHHCRKQRRKRKEEEMETLNKNVPSRSEDVLETDVA
ncbi:probetacellulin isoform X1 [Centrocercus urophasianus]|uniref:probetacellulin isoform X1 n=1 Tax=Centrocercus urophasianus TaxID=9002 RepID=UPI001C6469C6|nr:probetacellulin isoform X1 [Centrocercus urophasianus]